MSVCVGVCVHACLCVRCVTVFELCGVCVSVMFLCAAHTIIVKDKKNLGSFCRKKFRIQSVYMKSTYMDNQIWHS